MAMYNELDMEVTEVASTPTSQSKPFIRKPSVNMVNLYTKLCAERKVTPKNYLLMSWEELHAENQRLIAFYPPSQFQIEKINELINDLKEMDVTVKYDLKDLTGGKDGKADKLIQYLLKKKMDNSHLLPATDEQIKTICDMKLCPDCDWENYGISLKIDLEDGLWRRINRDELEVQVKNNFNRQSASHFISQFCGKYYEWKQSRLSPNMKRYIRTLEERLVKTRSLKSLEPVLLEDGSIEFRSTAKDRFRQYCPVGYTPLDDEQLDMFSFEAGKEFISRLTAELEHKDVAGDVQDETFEELRKFNRFDEKGTEITDSKKVKTEKDIPTAEYQILQKLLFQLEAIAGYSDEAVQDALTSLLTDGYDGTSIATSKSLLRAFMLHMIDIDCIDLPQLTGMLSSSKVATQILLGKF